MPMKERREERGEALSEHPSASAKKGPTKTTTPDDDRPQEPIEYEP